jgi:hypothetical protein
MFIGKRFEPVFIQRDEDGGTDESVPFPRCVSFFAKVSASLKLSYLKPLYRYTVFSSCVIEYRFINFLSSSFISNFLSCARITFMPGVIALH